MDLGIAGRRALVAASSAGLGLESARALVQAGCSVVISGRDQRRLDASAASLGDVTAVVADVSTAAGATRLVDEATAALGGLDILVTNAGGPPPGTFGSTPVEAYLDAVDLNLISVIAMCKAAVPPMQERRWGRVVAITSASVRQPIPNLILSNTARAGTTAFLKTLALEVAADGVTVNSAQPGLHATARVTEVYTDGLDSAAEAIPARRVGDPADFGRVVAFLCSESANYVTGTSLLVDGGMHRGLP